MKVALPGVLVCPWLVAALSGQAPDRWVRLTPTQTPATEVDRAARPDLIVCQEVVFKWNGSDVISESSFNLVVVAVVNPAGRIERFRVVTAPVVPASITDEPLQRALTAWRFRPKKGERAVEITFALPKEMGAARTSACGRLTRKR